MIVRIIFNNDSGADPADNITGKDIIFNQFVIAVGRNANRVLVNEGYNALQCFTHSLIIIEQKTDVNVLGQKES